MQIIDAPLLNALSEKARRSPRLRMNHNLHGGYDDPCQRLLNALEPGSYVRPHRHLHPPRAESFLALRGRLAVLLFNDAGELRQVLPLLPGGPVHGVDIRPGIWHSLLSLESGSVFFETKPGPYQPLIDKDFAPWAPAEGLGEAETFLAELKGRAELILHPAGGSL